MYVGSIYLVAKQKKVCSQRGANIFYFGFGVRIPTYTYTAYTERRRVGVGYIPKSPDRRIYVTVQVEFISNPDVLPNTRPVKFVLG